jgi:hypothetical protein
MLIYSFPESSVTICVSDACHLQSSWETVCKRLPHRQIADVTPKQLTQNIELTYVSITACLLNTCQDWWTRLNVRIKTAKTMHSSRLNVCIRNYTEDFYWSLTIFGRKRLDCKMHVVVNEIGNILWYGRKFFKVVEVFLSLIYLKGQPLAQFYFCLVVLPAQ